VPYSMTLGGVAHTFADLRAVFAAAAPLRSGDALAGIAASSMEERMAARYVLAELPLRQLLNEELIPYEQDEVTRLILDTHDAAAFAAVATLTVGEFRDWLLGDAATPEVLRSLAPGLTPEMVAGVQTHAQSGSHQRGAQVRGRDPVSDHDGPRGTPGRAPAAESSYG